MSLTVCIDGGGTKTALNILDTAGKPMKFLFNECETDTAWVGGSNINGPNGREDVNTAFETLFEKVKIGDDSLREIISKCNVIAGIAGVKMPEPNAKVAQILVEKGVVRERLKLMGDVDMALGLIESDKGAIVISGTGSVCFGKAEGREGRAGGFGPFFGEPGSGFYIGKQALQAGIKEEFKAGPVTSLTSALREKFKLMDLKPLVPQLNKGEVPRAEIAALAPVVIAQEGDDVATRILEKAARKLTKLVSWVVQDLDLKECEVHLWGGVFKSDSQAERVTEMMQEALRGRNITIVNQAKRNVAILYAQRVIANASAGSRAQPG